MEMRQRELLEKIRVTSRGRKVLRGRLIGLGVLAGSSDMYHGSTMNNEACMFAYGLGDGYYQCGRILIELNTLYLAMNA